MRAVEVLLLTYFSTFGVAALAGSGRCQRWRHTFAWAVGGVAVILTARFAAPGLPWVREWWPLAALPIAYWVPAPLSGGPMLALERWLQGVDERVGLSRSNRGGHLVLEIAYLFVYPMVPAGLAAALLTGGGDVAPRFWLAVLLAVLPCYGLLPLVPTRPPRAFLMPGTTSTDRSTSPRRANVAFLAAFGNQWNTLPSGHAAGAAAIATFLWRIGSPFWPLFAVLAAGIALGTVRGRYHYAVDTVLGVAVGILAAVLVRLG